MFTFLFLSSCSLPAIECSLSLFRNVRTYISSSPGRSLPVPSDCLVPGVVPGSPSPFSWGVPLVSTVSCSLLCLTSHVSLLVESVLQQLPKLAEEALLRCRRLSILIYPHFLELGQVSILDWRSFTSEFRRHCLFPFTSLVTAENSDAVTIPGFSLLEVFRIFFLVSNVVHVPDEVSRCRMGVFLSLVLGSFHRNYLTFPPLCVLCMFASPISFASSLRVSLFPSIFVSVFWLGASLGFWSPWMTAVFKTGRLTAGWKLSMSGTGHLSAVLGRSMTVSLSFSDSLEKNFPIS